MGFSCLAESTTNKLSASFGNAEIKHEWRDQKTDLKDILKKDDPINPDQSEYIFEWNEEPDTSKGKLLP